MFRPVRLAAETAEQLQRLEALADPGLAEFRIKDLLPELLIRVQDVMAVDTVAVLVLDRSGSRLVARAARGLEREVRQGFRLRIGHGFAGRIAATRSPLTIDDVGPDTVVNPILWRSGIRSLLGVPLVADGRLVGVMHVGTFKPRQFTDDDTSVLQVAADRVATTLVAERSAADRSAARTLQQSLLPDDLPEVEGLEFASRFVPAEDFGVGGDWYDAFQLPDGQIGIVVGDVAGTGLPAAVVMGRLRSSLQAYAIESASPGEALDRLRRKCAHFEPRQMATVLYITIAADLDSFVVASTGHLPPVVALPGHDSVLLGCSPSQPIGVTDAPRPVDMTCQLLPGTTIAVYTDGLVERRTAPIDDGLERLRAAVHPGPVEDVCNAVMDELIGDHTVADDIALLVCRRLPANEAAV
jgi:putative methionine-R-sulfoxide reductase with GAF domain